MFKPASGLAVYSCFNTRISASTRRGDCPHALQVSLSLNGCVTKNLTVPPAHPPISIFQHFLNQWLKPFFGNRSLRHQLLPGKGFAPLPASAFAAFGSAGFQRSLLLLFSGLTCLQELLHLLRHSKGTAMKDAQPCP